MTKEFKGPCPLCLERNANKLAWETIPYEFTSKREFVKLERDPTQKKINI